MENADKYRMVDSQSTGEYKEKGSKFMAYVFPVCDPSEVEHHLQELKKMHPKSRHICYGYRIGFDGNTFRANDDGEPSGTAGRPILGTIDGFGITNTLIAVVRYFGGTKLGVSGLIQAYKSAARDAMIKADISEKIIGEEYLISFDYGHMGVVMDAVKNLEIEIIQLYTEDKPSLLVNLPRSEVQHYLNSIKAALLDRPLEDVHEDTEIDYLTFAKA